MIIGPPDTLYEGGFFKCHLLFPKEYPLKPPELRILTEIWHPNIDKNGKVCISILHEPGKLWRSTKIILGFFCNSCSYFISRCITNTTTEESKNSWNNRTILREGEKVIQGIKSFLYLFSIPGFPRSFSCWIWFWSLK